MKQIRNFYLDAVKGRPSAEVFNGFICIYSLLQRRIDEYFRPYNLSGVKFNTLMLIKYIGGEKGVSQNDICHHLIVSPSNITRLIDRLIKDGYAKRTVSNEDRRVKLIQITNNGSELLNRIFEGYGEMIQQSVYLLERKDVEELSKLLLLWFSKLEVYMEGRKA